MNTARKIANDMLTRYGSDLTTYQKATLLWLANQLPVDDYTRNIIEKKLIG